MKLLLDENLSFRLIPELNKVFPQSSQISLLNLNQFSDKAVWEFAKKENFSIVTLDADFHELSLLNGRPPLVIWLRCGNQPKNIIKDKLINNLDKINEANTDFNIWCIEIY